MPSFVLHMMLAGPATFVRGMVRTPPGQQASWAGASLLIGIAAGIALVLIVLTVWRFVRDRRRRARTIQLMRRLIDDAEAATHDAVLVHQARRKVLTTKPRRT